MTRARATAEGIPVPMMAEYYSQRASAGLILTEGTYVSDQTCSFERAPGIYTEEQVEAWKPVTRAVTAEAIERALASQPRMLKLTAGQRKALRSAVSRG